MENKEKSKWSFGVSTPLPSPILNDQLSEDQLRKKKEKISMDFALHFFQKLKKRKMKMESGFLVSSKKSQKTNITTWNLTPQVSKLKVNCNLIWILFSISAKVGWYSGYTDC